MIQVIDHYDVEEKIRTESWYVVYQAVDRVSDKEVLVWQAFPGHALSTSFIETFVERMGQLEQLTHPNLLPVLQHWVEDGKIFWITPFIQGKWLAEITTEPRSEAAAAKICEQLAAGIEYLHEQGRVHGAVEPGHVLIAQNGQVLLCNYALIDLLNEEVRHWIPEKVLGIGLGSPKFLAPEQIAGYEATPLSDLYALGTLFYTLLCGKPPFHGLSITETALRQFASPISWPVEVRRRHLSAASIRLVHRCMAKQPQERIASASMVRKIFARISHRQLVFVPVKRNLLQGAPAPDLRLFQITILAILLLSGGWIFRGPIFAWLSSVQPPDISAAAGLQPSATSLPMVNTPEPTGPVEVPPAAIKITETEIFQPGDTPVPEEPLTPDILPVETEPAVHLPVMVGTSIPGEAQPISPVTIHQIDEMWRLGLGKLNQVAFSPFGDLLAIASSAGVFVLDGNQVSTFIDPGDEAYSVTFLGEQDHLAVGLKNGDIQVWDIRNIQLTQTFEGHTLRVTRILYDSDKKWIVSASADRQIRVWNLDDGSEARTYKEHSNVVNDIALTTDGKYLVSGDDDGVIKLWNMESDSGKSIWTRNSAYQAQAVAVWSSYPFLYVASGGESGYIELYQWHSISGEDQQLDSIAPKSRVWSLTYISQKKKLFVGLDDGKEMEYDVSQPAQDRPHPGPFRIKDVPYDINKRMAEERTEFLPKSKFTSYVAVTQDGSRWASITWDGQVRIAKQSITTIPSYESFDRLAFSQNGSYLIASGKLEQVFLWNLEKNEYIQKDKMVVPPGNPFSSDNKSVLIVTNNPVLGSSPGGTSQEYQAIGLFQPPAISLIKWLGLYQPGSVVSFWSNDALVAAVAPSKVMMWDTASGMETLVRSSLSRYCKEIKSENNAEIITVYAAGKLLDAQDETIQDICEYPVHTLSSISADNRWLVFVDDAGQVKVLDLDNPDLENQQVIWTDSSVTALAISPQADMLVTGHEDGSIQFWNIENGAPVFALRGHFAAIRAVAFSPDSLHFASASMDGTIRVWEVR